jgi:hypothetical protein
VPLAGYICANNVKAVIQGINKLTFIRINRANEKPDLSFPESSITDAFRVLRPYIIVNQKNGGTLKIMKFQNLVDPEVLNLEMLLQSKESATVS